MLKQSQPWVRTSEEFYIPCPPDGPIAQVLPYISPLQMRQIRQEFICPWSCDQQIAEQAVWLYNLCVLPLDHMASLRSQSVHQQLDSNRETLSLGSLPSFQVQRGGQNQYNLCMTWRSVYLFPFSEHFNFSYRQRPTSSPLWEDEGIRCLGVKATSGV